MYSGFTVSPLSARANSKVSLVLRWCWEKCSSLTGNEGFQNVQLITSHEAEIPGVPSISNTEDSVFFDVGIFMTRK